MCHCACLCTFYTRAREREIERECVCECVWACDWAVHHPAIPALHQYWCSKWEYFFPQHTSSDLFWCTSTRAYTQRQVWCKNCVWRLSMQSSVSTIHALVKITDCELCLNLFAHLSNQWVGYCNEQCLFALRDRRTAGISHICVWWWI